MSYTCGLKFEREIAISVGRGCVTGLLLTQWEVAQTVADDTAAARAPARVAKTAREVRMSRNCMLTI